MNRVDNGSTLAPLISALAAVIPVSGEDSDLLDDVNALATIIAGFDPDSASGCDLRAHLGQHLKKYATALSPALKAQLLFWQTVCDFLEEKSLLDPQLLTELQRLRPAFLALALRDQNQVMDAQQALRKFFEQLLREGIYWYPQSGKEAAAFGEALTQAVDRITAAARNTDGAQLTSAAQTFITLVDKQKTRAEMMEKRCSESESGMAKIHRAQIKVISLLDSLSGCALPETVLIFVCTTLKNELQFILINEGEAAGAWQSWCAIIKRLPQIFPVQEGPDQSVEPEPPNRSQLYRDVQIIVGLLDEHVTVSAAQQQSYDQGVEDLRERLFEKLRGINAPLVPFLPLTVPDELSRIGAAVSPSLLKKAAGLQPGDWFLFSNSEGQLLRCKLLLRPPEVEQLLFVNRAGHRVLQKSVQDFSACLATRIAIPLAAENVFERAIALAVAKLSALIEKNRALPEKIKVQQAPAETAQQSPNEITATAQLLTDSKPSASPASDRKSAAQKALQEARVLARLEIRRERQRTQIQSSPAKVTIGADSNDEQVASLNPGAWVELPQANGDALRCKLVAIMRSSDTYIFTDRSGAKVAEYKRTALAALLADNSARIISNGDDFEGQLSKVVLTLRRDT